MGPLTYHKKIKKITLDADDEIIVINETAAISFMNKSAYTRFGYEPNCSIQLNLKDLFPDIMLADVPIGKVIQEYGVNREGKTFPVFMKINPFKLDGKTYFFLILYNENNLSTLQEELSKPLKELMDLKFALDESTIVAITAENGIIKYVNEKFCEVSKYTAEELIGKDHRIINSGYHSKEFFKQMWRTISSGKVWKGEIRNRTKFGHVYWVDTTIVPFLKDNGKPYQYLAIRHEITERKKAEEEIQKMMTKIIDVQEEERKRLSRNLHDGIGQNLYSHLITISRLTAEVHHPLLEQMQKEATELIEEVREISWELRPSALDDLGLVPAIRTFLTRFSDYYNIDVIFDCMLHNRISVNKEITIYRIIQESLTNIRKYAAINEASVTIREYDDVVRVVIEDKGRGFERNKGTHGVGLFSMEERARAVNGTLQIKTNLGEGTKIILEVPI